MKLKAEKGQSTLEYLIIIAVIIAVLIGVAAAFKPKLEALYNKVGNKPAQMAGEALP